MKKKPQIGVEHDYYRGPRGPGKIDVHGPLFNEIMNGTDRVAGILGGAFVDECLMILLKSCLRKGKTTDLLLIGPLATFSSRINLAYSLGLTGPNFHNDLNIIREIRNNFAHWLLTKDDHHKLTSLSFQSPTVRDKCVKLWLPQQLPADAALDMSKPRSRFIYTAWNIGGFLTNEGNFGGHKSPLIESKWLKD